MKMRCFMPWPFIVVLFACEAWAQNAAEPIAAKTETPQKEEHPFILIHKVLLSPRCMNCHPKGDAPLQGDESQPHSMNIKRGLEKNGMACTTCHRANNVGKVNAPPGVEHWALPPKDFPMVFEGRSVQALCEQLRDPKTNKHRSLADLVEHVEHDALVRYGWTPGPGRTPVPYPFKDFVEAMKAWERREGHCPNDRTKWEVPQLKEQKQALKDSK